MGRILEGRGRAARRVKNPEIILETVRFSKSPFFSLFSIYLFYLYLFKINHLHFPRPLETVKIRKESRHKPRHKISATH